MIESEDERIESLKARIKTCKYWYGFCGMLGILAIGLLFLSILLGNKTLGLCALSWLAGSFFAFLASVLRSKGSELGDEICAIELSSQLETNLNNGASHSIETCFGPISMN